MVQQLKNGEAVFFEFRHFVDFVVGQSIEPFGQLLVGVAQTVDLNLNLLRTRDDVADSGLQQGPT